MMLWMVLAVLCCSPRPAGGQLQFGIIGGHEAKPHSRPYMVSFQVGGQHKCGGALIRRQWVLTVAHCFPDITKGAVRAIVGLHQLNYPLSPSQVFSIKGYFPHPDYKDASKENDIMLLQLSKKVSLNGHVALLGLPVKGKPVDPGKVCSVAGWGSLQGRGPIAPVLQEMKVSVMDTRQCNSSNFWRGEITETMMCLQGVPPDSAPCKGDSGDPVVCQNGKIQGLISFSFKGCIIKSKPPVATAVSKYLRWIKEIMA